MYFIGHKMKDIQIIGDGPNSKEKFRSDGNEKCVSGLKYVLGDLSRAVTIQCACTYLSKQSFSQV